MVRSKIKFTKATLNGLSKFNLHVCARTHKTKGKESTYLGGTGGRKGKEHCNML